MGSVGVCVLRVMHALKSFLKGMTRRFHMIRKDVIYDSATRLERRAGGQSSVADDMPRFLLPETARRYKSLLEEWEKKKDDAPEEDVQEDLAELFVVHCREKVSLMMACHRDEIRKIITEGKTVHAGFPYDGGDVERRVVKYRGRYYLCILSHRATDENTPLPLEGTDDVADFNAHELRAIDEDSD